MGPGTGAARVVSGRTFLYYQRVNKPCVSSRESPRIHSGPVEYLSFNLPADGEHLRRWASACLKGRDVARSRHLPSRTEQVRQRFAEPSAFMSQMSERV